MRRRCFSSSTTAASDRSSASVLVRAPSAFRALRTRSASTRSDIWSLAVEDRRDNLFLRGKPGARSALGGALDPAGHGGEGFVELGGVLAAGLSEVGAAAAAASDELRHFLDELAGLEALGQVLGDGGDEVDLAVHDGAEADHARAEPVAEGVDDGAKALGIEAVDTSGDHRDARYFLRGLDQLLGPALGKPRLELGELLLELLLLVEQLLQAPRQLERGDLEEARRLAQRGLLLAH